MITQDKEIGKRTLRAFVNDDTKLIPMMDEFEEYEDNPKMTKKYNRMILSNLIQSYYGTYRLIIERAKDVDTSKHDVIGSITMTQFQKEEIGKLKSFITSQLINMDRENTPMQCELPSYFIFKAQDSKMRRGYGSYYCGGYYEKGREYGECNYYYVTGIELINAK